MQVNGYFVNCEPHEYHGRIKIAKDKAIVNIGDVIKYYDIIMCVTNIEFNFYTFDKFPTICIMGNYWNERTQQYDTDCIQVAYDEEICYDVIWKM